MIFRKALAFVKRDLITETSYKFAFVFEVVTSVFPVLSFYFISKLVGGEGKVALSRYGGEYFPFVMIGVAFTQYLMVSLRTFANTIRRSQMAGCLEAMLSTRTSPQVVIILSSLYSFLIKTVHIVIIFIVGGVFLGVSYEKANILSMVVILMLTIVAFSSLGIFSATLIVLLKKGDPLEWIFGSFSALVGGSFFPVSILPGWLQVIAQYLPITHALEGMRLAVLEGYTVFMLSKTILILLLMGVFLLPLSVWMFSLAVEKGRRDGSLMHY